MSPALRFPAELLLQAQNIRVVFFDIDGVFTDGGVYFSKEGESIKRFNILDGIGIKMLLKAGIVPVVISGRDSAALRHRVAALGIEHAFFATEDKHPAAESVLEQLGIGWEDAAAMGDDWPDLPVLRRCALACAPAQAHVEVRTIAHHVTQLPGGAGAVREICDLLLVATGHYVELLETASR